MEELNVKGTLTPNAQIGAQSWFRCGGAADMLFEPADLEDLKSFLKQWDGPVTVIGGMANTIVRDGGVRGAVIRLGKPFAEIAVDGTHITAGAGALNGSVASTAAKSGIGGLEFLSGIPGTIGGATAMNAGAYGAEVKDILVTATGVTRAGDDITFTPSDLNMSYRHTDIPDGVILTGAVFNGVEEDEKIVRKRLKDIKQKRNETQPIREQTGGSTFANPSDDMRAWQVVEKVGGRGLQIGGAKMSEMHCNFMVNAGDATATDLENLGDELIKRASDEGLKLRWEIKRIGEK
jgi:UDP-N-acetylmuramate dehydrogenase